MIRKRLRKINIKIILYIKEKKICPAWILKINSNCEKQIILLIIPNEETEGWNYLALKKLSALPRRITSKHDGDFYCLNCLHPFRTKTNLSLMKKYAQIKIFVQF